MLLSHNNAHAKGDTPQPLPMQIIRVPQSENQDCWLMVFSDRTALIALEEVEHPGKVNVPLMRILPVVLRLSACANVPSSMHFQRGKYRISVDVADDKGHIMLYGEPPETDRFSLLQGPYQTRAIEEHVSLIQTGLATEINAWAQQISRAPCLIADQEGALSGVFGVDRPAPDPAVEGKRFFYPAFLAQKHFDQPQHDEAGRIFHLAFVHVASRHAAHFHHAEIRVLTDELRQNGTSKIVDVTLLAIAKNHDDSEDLSRQMAREFKDLLKHPSVPAYVTHLKGHGVVMQDKGRPATRSAPYMLYYSTAEKATSQHDRLAAHAFFEA